LKIHNKFLNPRAMLSYCHSGRYKKPRPERGNADSRMRRTSMMPLLDRHTGGYILLSILPPPALAGFNPHWPDLNLAVAGFQREQFSTDRQPPTGLASAKWGTSAFSGGQWVVGQFD
jgi:hypothetical protein